MQKIIYQDNDQSKIIFGEIVDEDEFFISLKARLSGTPFRIGKKFIVAMKEVNDDR